MVDKRSERLVWSRKRGDEAGRDQMGRKEDNRSHVRRVLVST